MKFVAKKTQTIYLLVLIAALSLTSCSKILSGDSGRAQELMEILITEPDNQERLNEVTLNKSWSAKNISPAVHGENTLNYLRARIKQNQVLDYKVSRQTKLNNKRSYVEVAVVESFPGILRKKKFTYVFRVYFKENNEGVTIITDCEKLT